MATTKAVKKRLKARRGNVIFIVGTPGLKDWLAERAARNRRAGYSNEALAILEDVRDRELAKGA